MKTARYNIFLLFSFIALFMVACIKEEPASIAFSSVEYDLMVGDTIDLRKEVVVVNAAELPEFTVDNEELVSLTPEGVLTALAEGEVRVTGHLGAVSSVCLIKIASPKLDTLIINAPRAMMVGSVKSVTVTVKPEKYDKNKLKWKFKPTDPALTYEADKVSESEYALKIKNYVQDAKLAITVSDSLSQKSQTVYVGVYEDGIPAESVVLEFPDRLTETVKTCIKAVVTPADYDPSHMDWTFQPSSPDLKFKYEKTGDLEYEFFFESYLKDAYVTVVATDRLSANEAIGEIKVLKMPHSGVVRLEMGLDAYKHVGFESFELAFITEPEDYDSALLEWSSSDKSVAAVDNGKVEVLGKGETVIKVKDTLSGKESECVVTIVEPVDADVRRIELDQTGIEVQVGEPSVQLVATCYDEDGKVVENYSGLEWEAEKIETEDGMKAVVEVSQQGVLTPLSAGSTIVYVRNKKMPETVKAICHVTVMEAPVKVQKIKLSPASKMVSVGKTFQLKAEVLPEEAQDKAVTYYSDDENIATVTQDGLVRGVAIGTTYIGVLASNGVESVCKVTVDDAWVEFTPEVLTLVEGETFALKAKVQPDGIDDGALTWSSSDPSIVRVDESGQLKALSVGEAEIKAVSSKGIEGVCTVTVLRDFGINIEILNEEVRKSGVHQFESFEMRVTYTNDFVPDKVEWVSSDPSALKITEQEGGKVLVEAIYEGKIPSKDVLKVDIVHKVSGKEKKVTVNVLPARPLKVVVGALPENNVLYLGETFDFKVSVEPWQAPQDVTVTGSLFLNQPVVAWNGTSITPANAGDFAVFFAAAGANVQTETFYITVKPKPVEGGKLSRSELSLEKGARARLTVTLSPVNNPNYDNTLKWASRDTDVASVENGWITAHKEGETVITVELSNGDVLSCPVTVVPAIVYDIAVGDFYYSDGSVSHELDKTKTVIGVVFSKEKPVYDGDSKLLDDYSGCTHGFVVGLDEYTTAYAADRDWGRTALVDWMNSNGYTQIEETDAACGYSNTLAMNAINAANVSSAGDVIRVDVCRKVAEYEAAVPSSPSSTGWYMPSVKEMKMLHDSLQKVNESLVAAGGESINAGGETSNQYYWHSTFYSDNFYPFNMYKGQTDIAATSAAEYPVRIILAF